MHWQRSKDNKKNTKSRGEGIRQKSSQVMAEKSLVQIDIIASLVNREDRKHNTLDTANA
jgi:hypothetical protein